MTAEARTCLAFHEHGVAVLGIPKVACQSLWAACIVAVGEDPGADIPRHPVVTERKCSAAEAKAQGLIVIGLCRHPLDRLVSLWGNKIMSTKTRGSRSMKRLGYTLGASFPTFVRQVERRRDVNQHTLPQHRFIAPEGRWSVDLLLRFEDLPGCWSEARRLWSALPDLPHRNPSTRPPWQDLYDAPTLALAERLYAEDLRLMGYSRNTASQ